MPTDHNVVFYGVEDGENDASLTPRFIGALLYPHNDFPLYQADESDQMGMAVVSHYKTRYLNKWHYYRNKRESIIKWSWFGPRISSRAIVRNKIYKNLSRQYRKGFGWFYRLDPTWKDLIGAIGSQTIQQGCQCVEVDNNSDHPVVGNFVIFPDATDCDNIGIGNLSCSPRYVTLVTTKSSDAFILESSASNGPGMNYPPQLMDGSNHMQMKNDSQMEIAIRKIFEEGLNINNPNAYFRTDFR